MMPQTKCSKAMEMALTLLKDIATLTKPERGGRKAGEGAAHL